MAAMIVGALSPSPCAAQPNSSKAEWEGTIEAPLAEAKDGCAEFDLAVEGRGGVVRLRWRARADDADQGSGERRRLGVDASANRAGATLIIPNASCTVIVTIKRRAQP